MKQLVLNIPLRDHATFANFYVSSNEALLVSLQALVARAGEHFVFLWGAPAVGCTHLLQACCYALSERLAATYLPLATIDRLTPDILSGLENQVLVCIDDVQSIIGQPEWEEALFAFYNRAVEQNVRLVIAADRPPAQLNFTLPDLQSRLASGLIFQGHGLNDGEKIKALQLHANARGLVLSNEVGTYLLQHYARDMTRLLVILEELDKASLVEQRRLTIPFVKSVL